MFSVQGKVQESAEGNITYTAVSAYLSNTTLKRRDVAKQLLGQLRKLPVENDADILATPRPTAIAERLG